jgi:hypothetical protein
MKGILNMKTKSASPAAIAANRFEVKMRSFHCMVAVPEWGVNSYKACIPAICRGEDSLKLADEIFGLHVALDDSFRPDLAHWACNNAGPIVAGRALMEAWQRGHDGGIMNRFSRPTLLKWFRRASPVGLMNAAERKVFNDLPDVVTAYRGAYEADPMWTVGGMSWTTDLKVAARFARYYRNRKRGGTACVVKAEFPRAAIVAYTNGRSERELILVWRRFRNRTYIPESDWPAEPVDQVA